MRHERVSRETVRALRSGEKVPVYLDGEYVVLVPDAPRSLWSRLAGWLR